jgi:hypothetical protein
MLTTWVRVRPRNEWPADHLAALDAAVREIGQESFQRLETVRAEIICLPERSEYLGGLDCGAPLFTVIKTELADGSFVNCSKIFQAVCGHIAEID